MIRDFRHASLLAFIEGMLQTRGALDLARFARSATDFAGLGFRENPAFMRLPGR